MWMEQHLWLESYSRCNHGPSEPVYAVQKHSLMEDAYDLTYVMEQKLWL